VHSLQHRGRLAAGLRQRLLLLQIQCDKTAAVDDFASF
jgi:hypothetical protein